MAKLSKYLTWGH